MKTGNSGVRTFRSRVGIFVLLLGVCVTTPAQGFNLLLPSEEEPVRWLQSGVPVFLDVRGSLNASIEAVEWAVLDALTAWNQVGCSNLVLRYAGLVTESPGVGIYIHWMFPEESEGLLALDAAGVTQSFVGTDGYIERADMHLNAQFTWTLDGDSFDPRRVDIQAVITHELGHALGLGHSRDRDSTMFFAGGDTSLQTLGLDDENGLCYLYPSGDQPRGLTCDPCVRSAGCESGRCLSFPEGKGAYCVAPCSADDDCQGGFSCTAIPSASESLCLPNNLDCGEASRGGKQGDYCYGGDTCESGRCLPSPRGAYCTDLCNFGGEQECPDSMECMPALTENCPPGVKDCGLCVKLGDQPIGGLCWDGGDCFSGICLGLPNQPGKCTAPCSNGEDDCGEDGICSLGICALPGRLPDGTPCTSPFDCIGGICAPLLSAASGGTICSRFCESFSDCPSNATCASFATGVACGPESPCEVGECDFQTRRCSCEVDGDCLGGLSCLEDGQGERFCGGSLCFPFPKKGRSGESCNEQVGCVGDLSCDWRGGTWGICYKPCDILGEPALDCGDEGECAWLPSPAAFAGACVERTAGRDMGQQCSLESPCHADLVCVDVGEDFARCVEDCWVEQATNCGFAETCVDLSAGIFPGRGACLPAGFEAPLLIDWEVVGGPPPPVEYGAPGGVSIPGEDYALIEHRRAPSASGCKGVRSRSGSAVVLTVVLLILCLPAFGRIKEMS